MAFFRRALRKLVAEVLKVSFESHVTTIQHYWFFEFWPQKFCAVKLCLAVPALKLLFLISMTTWVMGLLSDPPTHFCLFFWGGGH